MKWILNFTLVDKRYNDPLNLQRGESKVKLIPLVVGLFDIYLLFNNAGRSLLCFFLNVLAKTGRKLITVSACVYVYLVAFRM